MDIGKPIAWVAPLLFIAALTYCAEKRDWREGTLMSVEMIDIAAAAHRVEQHYQCVVSDGVYSYTMEYEHPIKATVRHRVKFVIERDQFVLLDEDGKERPARIAKRERVLLDSPEPRR